MSWPASASPPWPGSITASSPAPPRPGPTPSACRSCARRRCSTRSRKSQPSGSRASPRRSPAAGGSTPTSCSARATAGSRWRPSRVSTGRPVPAFCGIISPRAAAPSSNSTCARSRPPPWATNSPAVARRPCCVLAGYPEPAAAIVRSVRRDRRLAQIMIGAPAGQPEFAEWATLLGDDGAAIPFLRYLPERLSPLGARVGDGAARAAGGGALLRRLRGLRHDRRPRRGAPFGWPGPGPHGRILAAGCGRGQPRADQVLPRAGHQRLAVGLAAGPGRGPGSGRARSLPGAARGLRSGQSAIPCRPGRSLDDLHRTECRYLGLGWP